jgi:hypothetical protein
MTALTGPEGFFLSRFGNVANAGRKGRKDRKTRRETAAAVEQEQRTRNLAAKKRDSGQFLITDLHFDLIL